MIVVADTTPLNYLVLVGAIEILPKLFHDVFVPNEVMRELQHGGAPEEVRHWAQSPPPWIVIKTPNAIDPITSLLDRGEAEAISLAKELKASAILIDERRATRIARGEKLTVIRTLALLELAAERKMLELPTVLRKLQSTNFRISQKHIDAALQRHALKKNSE